MAVRRDPYYREVMYRLRRVGQAWRNVRILTGVFLCSTVVLAVFFLLTALECFFHFPAWVRFSMFLLFVMTVIFAVIAFIFKEILHLLGDEAVALRIEAVCPEANNALINCVRLGQDDLAWDRSMVEGFMFEAARGTRPISFQKAINRGQFLKYLLTTLALCVALIVFLFLSPLRFKNAVARVMKPMADIPAMGKVVLEDVEPKDCALLSGSTLAVRARIRGGEGEFIKGVLYYKFEKGERRAVPMSPAGENEFFCDISDVRMNLTYKVVISGTESKTYKVTIVQKPAVKAIELTYNYPTYTGLKERKVTDPDGNIEAVVGTRVEVKVTATKDILKGSLDFGEAPSKRLQPGNNPSILTGSILVTKSESYSIYLKDLEGYEVVNPPLRRITAIPDEKPSVVIKEPGKDSEAAVGGRLSLVIKSSDDFGVSKLRLLMQQGKEGKEKEVHVWEDFLDRKDIALKYDWLFFRGEYNDGDEITYLIEATDNCEPQPNVATSDRYLVQLQDPRKQTRDRVEKYQLWERELQKVLKMQQEARQRTGEVFEK